MSRYWTLRNRVVSPGTFGRRIYDWLVAPFKWLRYRGLGKKPILHGHIDCCVWISDDVLLLAGWFNVARPENLLVSLHLATGTERVRSRRLTHLQALRLPTGPALRSVLLIEAPSLRNSVASGRLDFHCEGSHLVLAAADVESRLTDIHGFASHTSAGNPRLFGPLMSFIIENTQPITHDERRRWSRRLCGIHEALQPRLPLASTGVGIAHSAMIDRICRIDEHRFVALGWLRDFEATPVRLTVFSPEGSQAEILPVLHRTARPDVTQVFGGPPSEERESSLGFAAFFTLQHPNYALVGWRLEYENDAGVQLGSRIVQVDRDAAIIRQMLFDVFTKCDEPKEKALASVLRPALEGLQERADSQPKIRSVDTFGEPGRNPRVSIVVPLYGRIDFVEHQLAQFADDPEICAADLIYVLDSPDLAAALRPLARELFHLYRVPFRLLTLERNVGYSGANNIGVEHARAELILLLNSDVIPDRRPGWLSKMADFYQSRAKMGALGAKLIYEDGSLQHAGIYFEPSWDGVGWMNSHYFKGLSHELAEANRTRRVPAVTGACLMISRALYAGVGGFSSAYIQGDCEDSDLCLKLSKSGRENWYLPDVTLYHLESQSYPTHLRQTVSVYNRWLHTEIWDADIAATMRRFSQLADVGESP